MAYFPFFVDLQDKKCFIMGGGEVAYRKAAALLPFGAHIYIKALTYCEKLTSLKNTTKGQIQLTLAYGTFEEADLEGCQFVIAATDDRALNRRIAQLCKEKNILINTVDDKELCSFYFPSLIKQDEVVVGISSGGIPACTARPTNTTDVVAGHSPVQSEPRVLKTIWLCTLKSRKKPKRSAKAVLLKFMKQDVKRNVR